MSANKKIVKTTALALMGSLAVPGLSNAYAQNVQQAASRFSPADSHVINLTDVDISVLIDDVSAITGYTFVVHPSVRGRVTVSSQTPLSGREVFEVFLSTLRVHGYTAVPSRGGVYKIIPEQTASSEAQIASRNVSGDVFETAVIRVTNIEPTEAAKMVKPITNPQGQVAASNGSDSIIIVDYAENIGRIRQVIAELDKNQYVTTTIALTHMSATEMSRIINGMKNGQGRLNGLSVDAQAVERNNSIILHGEEADLAEVYELVKSLDVVNRTDDASLKVISLKHSEAAELAPILERLGAQLAAQSSPAGAEAEKPTIAVYEPTNALIVSASPLVLRQLENVVLELDKRRSQVLVEAVIVELSDDATRELGVEFVLTGQDGSNVPLAATNFSRSTPNVLALAGALVLDGDGDSDTGTSSLSGLALDSLLSTSGAILGIGGQTNDGTIFGAILNAVENDTSSNILSTPSLLTLDNESAKISVGQEIPVTTGEALSASTTNPFRTVERMEVGVVLEVTPQIGEGDSIKLDLRQEVSSIFGQVSSGDDFITNKREIASTVLADDGEIIVLGGLIEEEETISMSKVPLLGDIPGIGRAFSSRGRSKTRTNLMVFLRPTIVRDAETIREASDTKRNYIRREQLRANGGDTPSLDRFMKDVLGVDEDQ